jgi:hypothetical protein
LVYACAYVVWRQSAPGFILSPSGGRLLLDGPLCHSSGAFNLSVGIITVHGPNGSLYSSDSGYFELGAAGSRLVPTIISYAGSFISKGVDKWWILRGSLTAYPRDPLVSYSTDDVTHLGANLLTGSSGVVSLNSGTSLEIVTSVTMKPFMTSNGPSTGGTLSQSQTSLLYTGIQSLLTLRGQSWSARAGSEIRLVNSGRILIASYPWYITSPFSGTVASSVSFSGVIISGDGSGNLRFGDDAYSSTEVVTAYLYSSCQYRGGNITVGYGSQLSHYDGTPTTFGNGGYFSDPSLRGLMGRSSDNVSLSINGRGSMSLYHIIINTTSTTSVTWSLSQVTMIAYYSYYVEYSKLLFAGSSSTLIIDGPFTISTGGYSSGTPTVRFPAQVNGSRNNGSMIVTYRGTVSVTGTSTPLLWSGGTLWLQSGGSLVIDGGSTMKIDAYSSNTTIITGAGFVSITYSSTYPYSQSTLRIMPNVTLDASSSTFSGNAPPFLPSISHHLCFLIPLSIIVHDYQNTVSGTLIADAQTNITIGNLNMKSSGSNYPTIKTTADAILGFNPIVVDTCTLKGNLYIILNGYSTITSTLLLTCRTKISTSRVCMILLLDHCFVAFPHRK